MLSKLLYADTLPNGYFSTASMASQLLLENMDTSFDTEVYYINRLSPLCSALMPVQADDMPTQFIGLEYRKKVIHSVGAHCEPFSFFFFLNENLFHSFTIIFPL